MAAKKKGKARQLSFDFDEPGKKKSAASGKKSAAKKAAGKVKAGKAIKPAGKKKVAVVKPKRSAAKASPVKSTSRPARKKAVAAAPGATRRRSSRTKAATAESMAAKQRDISISEFFAKNRHLLGFDNPRKALLTAVKEAVDNSLDACDEAHILPDITITIQPMPKSDNKFMLQITDNGPGIMRAQVPNIFARLLYGSKFHTLKMSRGQQGIGI
ncbi:MAG: ATP-binding protein, partial [Planctomycetes bacterium]|nr:ATP-binding protein [Planctomycetota bacterium]